MHAQGERQARAKLSWWDICAIRALLEAEKPTSVGRIARAFGISRRQVRRIGDRKQWK